MILTFGKWKKKTIQWVADNDPGYIQWLAREAKLDKEMAQALESVGYSLLPTAVLDSVRLRTAELVDELVELEPRYKSWQP